MWNGEETIFRQISYRAQVIYNNNQGILKLLNDREL